MTGHRLRAWGLVLVLVGAVVAALSIPACTTPYTARFDHAAQAEQKDLAGCPRFATDHDGNRYDTVLIGQQCWLAENLRVTRYRDGSEIPEAQLAVIDLEAYGRLYRWAAVAHRAGLCPSGWHVPSDAEFQQLELTIGMAPSTVEATGWRGAASESRKLKQFDVEGDWTAQARNLVNQSGFSALPGGGSSWVTTADGVYGDFWTSTEHDQDRAWYRGLTWLSLHPRRHQIRRVHVDKHQGSSVRCILDGPGADPADVLDRRAPQPRLPPDR